MGQSDGCRIEAVLWWPVVDDSLNQLDVLVGRKVSLSGQALVLPAGPAMSNDGSDCHDERILPRQMPRPRIPHLHLAGGEVLLPPSRHRRRGLLVREELLGVPGLHAGVD